MLLLSFILSAAVGVSTANAQVTGSVSEDNFLTITGSNVAMLGVDVQSPGGFLTPVPGGTASPFEFLLSNTATQVAYGSISSPYILDGTLKLSVAYDPTADLASDLAVQYGSNVQDSDPITILFSRPLPPVVTPVDPPVVPPKPLAPEPSSSLMLITAVLGLGVLRKRRS